MKRSLAVLLMLGLLAACANDASTTAAPSPDSDTGQSPTSRPESTPTDDATTTPVKSSDEESTTVELWYSITTGQGEGLVVVYRDIPSTPGIGAATLRTWLDGPTSQERAAGIHDVIPEGTELLGLDIQGGTAIVDLSSEFERTGMGSSGEFLLLEELAWTITQFPTVDRALLKIDGEFKDYYMGHGIIIDESHPLERNRRDPLAPILVSEPKFGDPFASGDVVQGTANVFEANVSIRLVDEDGDVLFEGFTTATCGTGCRGDYSKRIPFDVENQQPGTLELFEVSAEDGSETNKITVSVVLVP